ncbi:MAG: hypothetical protein PHP86_02555 [Nevskiales bacterium]|nr:hypothetical protein [Nevskiales bacterium]
MSFESLLHAQWSDYAEHHRDRVNLMIHIVAVPLFWIGALGAIGDLLFSGVLYALSGILWMALALFAQGIGHDREALQPVAQDNAWKLVQAIAAEQFINFPRFVFSGQWWKNLQAST